MSTLLPECFPTTSSLQDVVLVLSEQIGSGHDREVWRHPLNRALGVKVAKPEHERAQNDIDLHYSMHLERLGVAGPHLPRVHGWVRTDRGRGLVVDLVQRADGTPCPTLSQALLDGTISEMEAVGLVYEACDWLTRNGVMLADYGVDNFLVRESPSGDRAYLVFVDGLGTRHFDFKYWARCTFTPLEHWTARQKARAFRDRTLHMLRDRSSRLWVPKKRQHVAS
ncbi:YrbL family protein [Bordetella bronchialis]|uniref:YrbL family protein n=1 Tax=Bordetella bronchialis TaxID=463025 RepID=UPI003CFD52B8